MRPRLDLHLISIALRNLNDSAYFDERVRDFSGHFVGAIEHVLANPGLYDAAIEQAFASLARDVQSYLSGSTNNEIPYEVVFCLADALREWGFGNTAIVTSLTEGHNFHLRPLAPWQFIQKSITGYDARGFSLPLVMIGVPKMYAHKPIFCVPLFHELGHFVDLSRQITRVSLMLSPPSGTPTVTDLQHRMEHFADLFGASFVGRSSIAALEAIAPNQPASATHPSTADRVALVDAFLAGKSDPIIDMFQKALSVRGQRPLANMFEAISVGPAFDDLRTYPPGNMKEVYGIFDSAWNYLFDAIDQHKNPWGVPQISDGYIENLTNNLTEKSVRNFAIKEAWRVANSGP